MPWVPPRLFINQGRQNLKKSRRTSPRWVSQWIVHRKVPNRLCLSWSRVEQKPPTRASRILYLSFWPVYPCWQSFGLSDVVAAGFGPLRSNLPLIIHTRKSKIVVTGPGQGRECATMPRDFRSPGMREWETPLKSPRPAARPPTALPNTNVIGRPGQITTTTQQPRDKSQNTTVGVTSMF